MSPQPSRENAGFLDKLVTRRRALELLDGEPVVLEAFAGQGALGKLLYPAGFGVAIDANEKAAVRLATDRPTWRIYHGKSEQVLAAGLAGDVPVNFLDLDPFGEPWPAFEAFWTPKRELPNQIVVAAHDGMIRNLRARTAWRTGSLKAAVEHFGNDLLPIYERVCRWNVDRIIAGVGFELERFLAFRGEGKQDQNTHWVAVCRRPAD